MKNQPPNSKNKKLAKDPNQNLQSLSYAESLAKLETILDKLIDDKIPIEEIQKHYLEGKKYLEHCETLLNKLEKSVIEIDLEKGLGQELE